jgi:hypothetical protein
MFHIFLCANVKNNFKKIKNYYLYIFQHKKLFKNNQNYIIKEAYIF